MIKELSNGEHAEELEPCGFPEKFFDITRQITRRKEKEESVGYASDKKIKTTSYVIDGFEDLIKGPLGDGLYSNTQGTAFQLAFVLSLSSQTIMATIKTLRDNQVLSGLKILDLGSGNFPTFALAARALGAEVYTADYDDLSPNIRTGVSGHVKLDLNDKDTIAKLIQTVGKDFDVVTENIISPGPFAPTRLKSPTHEVILEIAKQLLKKGGLFYFPLRAEVLRKR